MNFLEQNTQERYQQAKIQVNKLRGFYIHLSVYSIFVVIFSILNIISTSFPWALFPIIGWGLGILGHASDTFALPFFFGKKWEQRKIEELMSKDQ